MTRQRAIEILQAYRPGRDDDEPLCIEALDFARRDLELQAWFEKQNQLDAAIRRKLLQASTPSDLLAQIHAGVAARRARRWQQSLALAACLVLVGVLAFFWINRTVL